MARYVLVEFDDNTVAEEFVESLKINGGTYYRGADEHMHDVDPEKARVRAFFAKPTQFCDCKPPSDRQPLSKNYQWRVCPKCNKPIRGQWQHPRNLLDPLGIDPRERYLYLGIIEGRAK